MSRRAAQMLTAARATVLRGWCKGSPARDAQGVPVMPESPRAAAWSPTGALMLAASTLGVEWGEASVDAVLALARAVDKAATKATAYRVVADKNDALDGGAAAVAWINEAIAIARGGAGRGG